MTVNSSSGAILQRQDVTEWGEVLFNSNPDVLPFGLAGGIQHTNGEFLSLGARTYSTKLARWLTPDPARFLDGSNRFVYVGNDPVNTKDPSGLWSPGAHDALIDHALVNRLTPRELAVVKQASRDFDKATQSVEESYKHSMRQKDQSIEEAERLRDEFVRKKLQEARAAIGCGNSDEALRLLGEALHPLMDWSSPMHSDAGGDPKEWNPWWPVGHSPSDFLGDETIHDVTESVYQQQDVIINYAYEQVFGDN